VFPPASASRSGDAAQHMPSNNFSNERHNGARTARRAGSRVPVLSGVPHFAIELRTKVLAVLRGRKLLAGDGIAEFKRSLIPTKAAAVRWLMASNSARAELTKHQAREAPRREIALSYAADHSTISRLEARHVRSTRRPDLWRSSANVVGEFDLVPLAVQ
jgi:hypothetical protein